MEEYDDDDCIISFLFLTTWKIKEQFLKQSDNYILKSRVEDKSQMNLSLSRKFRLTKEVKRLSRRLENFKASV